MVSGFSKDTGSELAMVVSRNSKELVEIVKEVDEYFLKAADAGSQLSVLLEVSNSNFSNQSKGGISLSFFQFYLSKNVHSFDFLVGFHFYLFVCSLLWQIKCITMVAI